MDGWCIVYRYFENGVHSFCGIFARLFIVFYLIELTIEFPKKMMFI